MIKIREIRISEKKQNAEGESKSEPTKTLLQDTKGS